MPETNLTLPVPQEIRRELGLREPSAPGEGANVPAGLSGATPAGDASADLDRLAEEAVGRLLGTGPEDVAKKAEARDNVEALGIELQKKAASQSEMLKRPLADLSRRGEEGGPVARAIIDLKMQVEELDPGKLDLQPGWLSRTLGKLPGVGSPLKRYFTKFESSQTVIAAIIRSLEQGRDQLARDNVTLLEDQRRMLEMGRQLEEAIRLAQLIDGKLQYRLDRELDPSDPRHKFVAEELLFPLRQRTLDLQQQLAVNQQGVLAMELIMRNNKELIRGVNRSLNVTVGALQTAVTVAMALENQKITLDKMDAINQATSSLIAGTASRLKTQGVEIQKRASGTTLNLDSLKAAFNDLRAATDDLSDFRRKALPQMASAVLELDQLSSRAKQEVEGLERSGDQGAVLAGRK